MSTPISFAPNSPPSPSNPPSPNSRDVPLLRLDSSDATNRRRPSAFPEMPSASTSGRLSPSPAGLGGIGGSRISPRERKQGNPITQFRSTNSLRSSSSSGTLKGSASNAGDGLLSSRGKRIGNFKGKDRYSDTPEDDEIDLLGATPGLRGRGEADGEFDEGWTGADDEREGLLGVRRRNWSKAGCWN